MFVALNRPLTIQKLLEEAKIVATNFATIIYVLFNINPTFYSLPLLVLNAFPCVDLKS